MKKHFRIRIFERGLWSIGGHIGWLPYDGLYLSVTLLKLNIVIHSKGDIR